MMNTLTPIKLSTRLNDMSHCKTESGTNWSIGWNYLGRSKKTFTTPAAKVCLLLLLPLFDRLRVGWMRWIYIFTLLIDSGLIG